MILGRRNILFLVVAVIIITVIPGFVAASEYIAKKSITIPRDQIIKDDLYLYSSYSKIYGRIIGDLTAFGYDINAVGEVDGNVNLGGYRADFYGTTSKSARLFGYDISVGGEIDGNLIAIGNMIGIDEKTSIGRDITCYGSEITMDGSVGGRASLNGKTVVISGIIDGDVKIEADKILIIPPAHIKGNLKYFSPREAVIEGGAIIDGEKIWKTRTGIDSDKEGISIVSMAVKILLFVIALITGLIFIYFFRDHTDESSQQLRGNFWIVLASGCLSFICFTFGALILMLLIIGIPLGLFLIFIGLALFYLGRIYVAIVLGYQIMKWTRRDSLPAVGWQFFLGLIILTILFQIPVLGTIVYLLTALIGSGAAVYGFLSLRKKYRAMAIPSGGPKIT